MGVAADPGIDEMLKEFLEKDRALTARGVTLENLANIIRKHTEEDRRYQDEDRRYKAAQEIAHRHDREAQEKLHEKWHARFNEMMPILIKLQERDRLLNELHADVERLKPRVGTLETRVEDLRDDKENTDRFLIDTRDRAVKAETLAVSRGGSHSSPRPPKPPSAVAVWLDKAFGKLFATIFSSTAGKIALFVASAVAGAVIHYLKTVWMRGK